MTKRTHPLQSLPNPVPARIAGMVAFMAIVAGMLLLLLQVVPPIGWDPINEFAVPLNIAEFGRIFSANAARSNWVGAALLTTMADLADASAGTQMFVVFIAAVLAGAWAGRDVYRARLKVEPPVPTATTILGGEPRFGGAGLAVLEDAWGDRRLVEGKGVFLAPGIVMPLDVETEHVAIMGATGAGKSTIIEGIALQGIRRGDRALLVDVKGGLAQRFGLKSVAEIGLEPTNGAIWQIGTDISSRELATEFSAVMIPPSRDPIWSDGARLYLTGLIVALQKQHNTRWNWRHLRDQLALPFAEQEKVIRESMPDIAHLLQMKEGDPTATVMSILVTVVANVASLVWTMAEREEAGGSRFSLRAWAAGRSRRQVVVLRLEYERETQSAALLKLALRCVQSTLLGGEVKDGVDNAVWLALDELASFADSQTIGRLVALGRSRGIRILAALQTPAQLRREIGADATTALLANFGIQIFSRVAPGPDRKEVSERWFGQRTMAWTEYTPKNPQDERQTKDIPVLAEDELTGTLGKFYRPNGRPFVRAAIAGFKNVPILDWPIGWADHL